MSVWSRITNVLRGARLSREIDEEFEAHIAEAVEQGRDPDEARRAFGSILRLREESQDIRLVAWCQWLRAEAVFGWRQLSRRKVTSAAAILSLALTIGSCLSAFRLIDAMYLRPLPIVHPERLYALSRLGTGPDGKPTDFDGWAYPDFELMRDAAKRQATLIAVSYDSRLDLTYKSDDEMEKAHFQYVSGTLFSTFGLQPALGRLLSVSDDLTPGSHPVAVISYDYWTRRFANNPAVLGKSFRMGTNIFQIIGVSQSPFSGTEPGTMTDIFLPAVMNPAAVRKDSTWHRTFAVLNSGRAIEPLRAKLDAVSRAFETERSKSWINEPPQEIARELNQTLHFSPAPSGSSGFQQDNRHAVLTLAILVFLVLLVACANVANLMVAQAAARTREMALRISIGAGRHHLVRLVLVQSAIVASVSSAIGALFAAWSAPLVVSTINPPDNPVRLALPVDWRLFVFAAALTLAVTCLFGLIPALRASAVQPAGALKGSENPRSRHRIMYALIAAQVAFCCLVLFATGLFVTTFERLSHQSTGFSSDRLLVLDTVTHHPRAAISWLQVADQLRNVPGVLRVSVCDRALLDNYSNNNSVSINGSAPSAALAYFLHVSPGWLETMRISLLDGRDFLPSETDPGAALVNETFVKTFFNGENPVGKSFEQDYVEKSRAHYQIVGLVRDAGYRNVREKTLPTAYLPFLSADSGPWWSSHGATFIVRTASADPRALASILRREVPHAGPGFRVSNIRTQEEINVAQTVRERLLARLASFFAIVALLLAAVGLYGVLDYSVLQRRHEIGIRIALGAPATDIARRVMSDVLAMVLVGSVTGLAISLASARYIASLLYDVKPTDTFVLTLPCLILTATVALSAMSPVIRAVRIPPAQSLRTE